MATLLDPDQRDTLQTSQVAGLAQRLPAPAQPAAPSDALDITLLINSAEHRLKVDPRTTLLDALREHLGLTGTKKGCDLGQCGACTVLVAGRRINACLTLAIMQQGKAITMIEGLARDGALHPALHLDDPGRRRRARPAGGESTLRARRQSLAQGSRARRVDDHGERQVGGARGVRRGAPPGPRARARRRQLAAPWCLR